MTDDEALARAGVTVDGFTFAVETERGIFPMRGEGHWRFFLAEAIRNAVKKPAPAPGAEAAIEALVEHGNRLDFWKSKNGHGYCARLTRPGGGTRTEQGPTLSAALAALRGEAK